MIFFPVAFGLWLHVLFWGAGAAVLAMPHRWRRFWPVLAAPTGFALQSLVVWTGAYANLPGTNRYAWASEVIPVVLLGLAWCYRRPRLWCSDIGRFGVVGAMTAGCLAALVLPLAFASKGLTTVSLGSCDAADYAAGARVLMEFAHSDRSGFLGLTEVVSVASVDNFFDFWLRLNHFTPSALIAFNGTIFDCAPHELTSVLTTVLLASSVPVAFWMARAVMRYSSTVSVAVAMLYGLSPIGWYAVGHVAMGQLLAAQAIALLTWAGVALWRGRLTWRHGVAFGGVLAIGYVLVLGSYNFILLVCLVPALAYAGGLALWRDGDRATGGRQFGRFGRWLLAMLAPLVVAGVVMFDRVAGLAERFALFKQYDFGWPIPVLTPEGWLGMVSGPELQPWRFLGLRWLLAAAVVVMLGWTVWRAVRLRRQAAWTAACLSLPVLVGYLWLELRGARLGTNASYDAFKLLAVFYPGLLAACCWWVTLRRGSQRLGEWLVVAAMAVLVLGFNLLADGMFAWAMSHPPLIVSSELKQLRKIEAMPDVASLNMMIPESEMWARLWANAFLLKKAQYFPTHTYEGRLNTPLRGDWDLQGGIIRVKTPGDSLRPIVPHHTLVDARGPRFLRVTLDAGWHVAEIDPKNGERWRWTKGDAMLRVENPHDYPLKVVCTIDGWSFGGERDLTMGIKDGGVSLPVRLGGSRVKTTFSEIMVPLGVSTLVLHSPQPPAHVAAGDARPLGVCVFGCEIEVLAP